MPLAGNEAGSVGHPGESEALLDRAGDAVQRGKEVWVAVGFGVGGVRLFAGLVQSRGDDRIERRIDSLEMLDVGLEDLARTDFTLTDTTRKFDGRQTKQRTQLSLRGRALRYQMRVGGAKVRGAGAGWPRQGSQRGSHDAHPGG